MTNKPQWKVEYDRQKGELQMEIAEVLTGYPEPVVREVLAELLTREVGDQARREYSNGR